MTGWGAGKNNLEDIIFLKIGEQQILFQAAI
jgi:hypothetical protein